MTDSDGEPCRHWLPGPRMTHSSAPSVSSRERCQVLRLGDPMLGETGHPYGLHSVLFREDHARVVGSSGHHGLGL